jgi:hypothetical protein
MEHDLAERTEKILATTPKDDSKQAKMIEELREMGFIKKPEYTLACGNHRPVSRAR